MELAKNQFKQALKKGDVQLGIWTQLGSAITAEILAGCGYDFIGLDGEHGPSEYLDIYAQLQACAAGGPSQPIVRIPNHDISLIKRYLDAGVNTLMVPQVDTAEQAKALVSAVRYPPHGVRGYCGAPRASGFGRIKNYATACDAEICLIVMPETRQALENIEAMAAIDGVDAFFIGPGDLAASLGYIGQPMHPEVVRVIEETGRRVQAAGKAVGILCTDETQTRRYIELGFQIVAIGSDQGLLTKGAEHLLAKFR
ncbi:HpcH/HpaI aldolase/citrate lyase family protein [Kosakonia sp. BYX6]|uniref:HpcH/HpaI aldolase/citrate lyase family protein n=1 Tax=Kosakonia calanthes TaxID=3139408 RepID=A0ABZ3B2N8_9ENTR